VCVAITSEPLRDDVCCALPYIQALLVKEILIRNFRFLFFSFKKTIEEKWYKRIDTLLLFTTDASTI
jgi:hypothetical protein